MHDVWDVAVVGAGPAGATSALLLSRAGYRVILLDRAHFPRPKTCAEYLSPGVVQTLVRLGVGDSFFGAHPFRLSGMEIVSASGRHHRLAYSETEVSKSAAALERRTLDELLVREAVRSGAALTQGFLAREPMMQDAQVKGVRGTREGRQETIRARMTLICDGSGSTLARRLGLVTRLRWPVRTGLVAHYEGQALLPDGFGQMHVGPGGYCGIAPLSPQRVNVAMVARTDALRLSGMSATKYFESFIAARPRLGAVIAGCRPTDRVRGISPIGNRVWRTWVNGALLVGDAAGFFDPFTGEGIYRALKGAEVAAEVVDSALRRDDMTVRTLAPYSDLRKNAFRSKQAATALVQLFVHYPQAMEYVLPRLAKREEAASVLARVLGDIEDAGMFLRPSNLWATLHP